MMGKVRTSSRCERTPLEKFHLPNDSKNLPIAAGVRLSIIGYTPYRLLRPDYFFTPRMASFATLATRNLTTVLAGILIFCWVLGLKPVRAFLFCFTSLPKPGKTNSPFFLIAL